MREMIRELYERKSVRAYTGEKIPEAPAEEEKPGEKEDAPEGLEN